MFSAVGCWYGTCVEVEVLVVLVVGLNPRILDFVRNTAMIIRNVPDFAYLTSSKSKIQKKYLAFNDSKAWRQYREPQAVE